VPETELCDELEPKLNPPWLVDELEVPEELELLDEFELLELDGVVEELELPESSELPFVICVDVFVLLVVVVLIT
jgi:hypothetical protein